MGLRDEAVVLLQELIRADTVNPPGNETRAADILRDSLARGGIASGSLAPHTPPLDGPGYLTLRQAQRVADMNGALSLL